MIMEAEKSADLQPASWRPREAGDISFTMNLLRTGEPTVLILVQRLAGLGPKKSGIFSSIPKAGKDGYLSSWSWAGGVPSYSAFLFYSGLQLVD